MLSSIFVTHLLNLTHKNNATTQSHIVWLDVIRTVAMLMVGVHCIDPFISHLHSEVYRNINIGLLLLSFTTSVPLFVMMTDFTIAYTGTIFRCFL